MPTIIATVSMRVSYNKAENLERYVHYIQEAARAGVGLIVFPEESLQGYMEDTRNLPPEIVQHHHAEAESVPDGPSCQTLQSLARQHRLHICFGMTERDARYRDVLYNSAVLLSPDGLVGVYRKVHQPGTEVHLFYPGEDFPVFDTEIGRIGMIICYDKRFPESCRELALQGAEIILMPTAWPMASLEGDVRKDPKGIQYDVFDIARAVENECWFVSSNWIGPHGPYRYYGHSRIVAPTGRVAAEVGYEEGMAVATCEVQGEILAAYMAMKGHSVMKDRRPSAYRALGSGRYQWRTSFEGTEKREQRR